MYNLRYVFFLAFIVFTQLCYSQETGIKTDSLKLETPPVVADTTILSDTIRNDSIATEPVGDLQTQVKYNATDSIIMEAATQRVHLYKNAKITYGNIELTGEYVMIDFLNETVKAKPGIDSTGKVIGRPVFKEGDESYTTDSMQYNFATRKAIIYNVITQQGGGFLLGDRVKKNQYDELFVSEGKFCPCETPVAGTYVKSEKIKVIPKKKILTGPAQLFVGDVPTPLFIPFSMFPAPKEKSSGIRIPTYGEERRRGFFLRNGGYYLAINDYMDLDILGSIYSKGGMGLSLTSTYRKRYRYNGTFNFSYEKIISGEIEDSVALNTFWVRWNHSPQSRGSSRFSASVNAGTSSYNENVQRSVEQNTSAQFNSNVTYSKTFTGTPVNIAMSARHSQNVGTGVVNLTLPDFSLNVSRITPFKNVGTGRGGVLRNLNFSYRFTSTVQLSNAAVRGSTGYTIQNDNPLNDSIIGFNTDNIGLLFDRAKIGGRHTIPISTSFKLFKYFTVSPNFNYEELWYPNKLEYEFIEEENAVRIDTVRGFTRAFNYSGGVSVNTNIYGIYNFKPGKRLQAIRHTIRPSINFSYRPDFSDPKYGFYQNLRTDTTSVNTQLISNFNGFVYGAPGSGESGSIGFSITNNLEMKMLAKDDTTGKAEKVSLIDNFGASANYNIVADSFNLSNINLNLRTKLFNKKLDFASSATLDPYTYELESSTELPNGSNRVVQRRVSKYAWNTGNGLGQITSARLALSTSLSPKKKQTERTSGQDAEDDLAEEDNPVAGRAEDIGYINGDPGLYVDFDVPWDLRVAYTLSYSKRGFEDATVTQGVRFNGNLKLTPKWNIGFSSGYDITKKEFTQTRIDVTRDLNCWMMVFNWTPFGRYTSYSFTIRIKSALLKDLKYSKRESFQDRL